MKKKGYDLVEVPCDVTEYESCAKAVTRGQDNLGPIDTGVDKGPIRLPKQSRRFQALACLPQLLQWQRWDMPMPSKPVGSLRRGSVSFRGRPAPAAR